MEARRREEEHEREREVRRGPARVERETMVERQRDYPYWARIGEHRDAVHWGSVWVGLITSFAVLSFLGLIALTVGLFATPGTPTTVSGPSFGTGAVTVIAVLISFFIGGWLAGRTSSARGMFAGLALGSMIWGLGFVLLTLLALIGVGGVLASISATFGGLGAVPGGTAQAAALPTLTMLIGVILAWAVTVAGSMFGSSTRAPEVGDY